MEEGATECVSLWAHPCYHAQLSALPSLTLHFSPAPRSSRGHPGCGAGLQRPGGSLPDPAPDPGLTGLLDSGMR